MLRAHPRVGGENAGPIDAKSSARGSSPRGRGKRRRPRHRAHPRGLIPAWAGKTLSAPKPSTACAAHPRVGGENAPPSMAIRLGWGSSPRGRGKPWGPSSPAQQPRLIPAWAGKTPGYSPGKDIYQAHPRVGGENTVRRRRPIHEGGSSPRGRGKLGDAGADGVERGLIPAWAGKTRTAACRSCPWWAHPRVGGENAPNRVPSSWYSGSSPRGRGKPGWWL